MSDSRKLRQGHLGKGQWGKEENMYVRRVTRNLREKYDLYIQK